MASVSKRGLSVIDGEPTPLAVVLGPSGTGKTFVAANLALALAERDARVVLVDLDLRFGDLGFALGLSPGRTLADLVTARPPFDHAKLDAHLVRHSSGVRVLVAPLPGQSSAVSIAYLREVYASLRTMCDAVVVDTSQSFTTEVIATIDISSALCIVGIPERLTETAVELEALDQLGLQRERVRLVRNRADSNRYLTSDAVSAIGGRVLDVSIPTVDEMLVVSAWRDSRAVEGFRLLADFVMASPPPDLPLAPPPPLPPAEAAFGVA